MRHSEKQYLELETNFLNLFNAVESLLTITEGENLDSDQLKARHLGALSIRLNDISERFSKIKQEVQSNMFRVDTVIHKKPPVALEEKESKMLIECIEHFISMWEKVDNPMPYKDLLNKLTNKSELPQDRSNND